MEFISWSDDLEVGNDEIDHQHKELIDNVQKLLSVAALDEAGIDGSQTQKEALKMFLFLEDYVKEHFSYEERVMERYHCPLASVNKKEHDLFIIRLSKLKRAIEKNGFTRGNIVKMETLLCHWLVHHILTVDKEMGIYIQEQHGESVGFIRKAWRKIF